MLEDLPHRVMGDMAVVCKIYMTPDARITIPINKDLLSEYGITENRLFEIATKNSERDYPVTLESLEEVVKAMNLGLELPTPEENRLYILTNSERMNGAAVLFYPGMCEKLAGSISRWLLRASIFYAGMPDSSNGRISWFHRRLRGETFCYDTGNQRRTGFAQRNSFPIMHTYTTRPKRKWSCAKTSKHAPLSTGPTGRDARKEEKNGNKSGYADHFR